MRGRRLSGRLMTLFVGAEWPAGRHARHRGHPENGLGRRQKPAKRLARELFRHHKPTGGLDIVVIVPAARCSMHPMSPSRPNSERSSTVGTSLSRPRPVRSRPALGLALIRAYKVLFSPWFTGSCRFVPGCADYTAEAIARYGLLRGSWLGARRLGRCHPLGGHGLRPRASPPHVPVISSNDRTAPSFHGTPRSSRHLPLVSGAVRLPDLFRASAAGARRWRPAPAVSTPACRIAAAVAAQPPATSTPAPAAGTGPVLVGESDGARHHGRDPAPSAPSSPTAAARLAHWVLKDYKNDGGQPLDLVPKPENVNNALTPFSLRLDDQALTSKANGGLYPVRVAGRC